jgi:hypothetical protein
MRDFYGCYLLQSKKEGATGRTYIGCASVPSPVLLVAATSLASEPCTCAGSRSTRGGALGSTMARSRPALCTQSGEAARRAGKQCCAGKQCSAFLRCVDLHSHAAAAYLQHCVLKQRSSTCRCQDGCCVRRFRPWDMVLVVYGFPTQVRQAGCALRCLVLARTLTVLCLPSPRAPLARRCRRCSSSGPGSTRTSPRRCARRSRGCARLT